MSESAADPHTDTTDTADPALSGEGDRRSRLKRFAQWHSRMGTANRIALYGVVCAVLAYVTPLGQVLYEKVFPDRAIALLCCFSDCC
ncbi:hypothetical protein [Streptomyces sp. 7N604]|uniref:hypothetical protein n=1 Tax=Streptomyces sp. 7N604 TaxID=3457415 RepID=UPI003FD37EF4